MTRRRTSSGAVLFEFVDYSPLRLAVPTHEARLHQALMEHAQNLLTDQSGSPWILHELLLPFGRPDITVASVDEDAFERRRQAGIRPCPSLKAMIAAGKLRLGHKPDKSLSRAIGELRAAGIVERTDGTDGLHSSWAPAVREVQAVEAKVSGWQGAAMQARSWSLAVDGVWLAFPESYMGNVPRSEVSLRRFGLVAVEPDGGVRRVRKPKPRRPDPSNRMVVEELVYRRWLDTTNASE